MARAAGAARQAYSATIAAAAARRPRLFPMGREISGSIRKNRRQAHLPGGGSPDADIRSVPLYGPAQNGKWLLSPFFFPLPRVRGSTPLQLFGLVSGWQSFVPMVVSFLSCSGLLSEAPTVPAPPEPFSDVPKTEKKVFVWTRVNSFEAFRLAMPRLALLVSRTTSPSV